jgi:ubiquinone/menaquinone biosynthesis C-methylase UbiE
MSLFSSAFESPYRLRAWLLKQPFFTSTLLPAIPRPVRWTLRKLYFLPLDALERVLGKREPLFPPKSQIFSGSVDGFKRSGRRLVELLVDFNALTPDSRVLDIGSGNGRLAVALVPYLSSQGSYDGLDIVETGIRWGNKEISSKLPNFTFTFADIINSEYNPRGRVKASDYRFPYSDNSFDLVVLVSVFTHMLPSDVTHYVHEIARVLKPQGFCFSTHFLINSESRQLMNNPSCSVHFKEEIGPHWLVNPNAPELSVAYEEAFVIDLFRQSGLAAGDDIHYGGWCGRRPLWSDQAGPGDQDVVLARKL